MKKYPKYKPSGVEWIGDVPEHWVVSKIKFLPSSEPLSFIDGDWIESKDIIFEGRIRYITTGNIGEGKYKEQGHSFISEETFSRLDCTEVFPGDLLISRLNNPIGRSCIIPDLGFRIVTSVDNVILRPKKEFDKLYLNFLMNNDKYFEFTDLIARGATMQRISRGLLAGIKLCIPPTIEQAAIAAYLDRKTAQIDQAIAEKEGLIELFREERQAIINHAVTKGIRPGAKMKPSGVEWIGDVPEGWEVRKVSRSFKMIGSGTTPKVDTDEYYTQGTVSWVLTGDLDDGVLQSTSKKISETAFNDHSTLKIYPTGSLVVAMYGATIGKTALLGIPACTNQACCVLAESDFFEIRFVHYWFLSNKQAIINLGYGGGQPNINQEIIKSLKIPCPDLPEQTAIVAYLDHKTTEIDQAISGIRQEIALLQEYRQALIFEAVTGKIDVRN